MYGWPKENLGSLKSIPACYLTGFLLGKKILKIGKKECILDIGMIRSIKKSRVYAFLKGVVDSGVKMNVEKEVFPDEKRIKGEHTKVKNIFEKVKESIKHEA
jgi:large subunit ribosomal protein L18